MAYLRIVIRNENEKENPNGRRIEAIRCGVMGNME